MTRVGDIVGEWETRGDLVARGYTERDAEEAIAFRIFLKRLGVDDDHLSGDEREYAAARLSAHDYLQRVAPEELTR